MALIDVLRAGPSVVSVELRPPMAELNAAAGMDAWIDTYHSVSGLVRNGLPVFLTDSAVGVREENNLRHLVTNLGTRVSRDQVVPFLTSKHSLDFCLNYAERAWHEGFSSLVVLGGDTSVGAPRCVEHAWQLRKKIHAHMPELSLGGWANPHADAGRQAGFLAERFFADFFLTQIVSHHHAPQVEAFLDACARRDITKPGIFGVFYYRSANRKTLETLSRFLPVPVEGLVAEFAAGDSPEDICARTIRELRAAGVRHIYVSNLPVHKARQTMAAILAKV